MPARLADATAVTRAAFGLARIGFDRGLAECRDLLSRVLPSDPGDVLAGPLDSAEGSVRRGFQAEADMIPVLTKFVHARWISTHPTETWVILEEQRMHSRIADLVIVRLDIPTLIARRDGGWLQPLRLSELRVLATLRGDRATTLATVAARAKLEPDNATRILQGLARTGFIAREGPSYRRLVPLSALAQRVVSFEAKRSEPRRALAQARAHRAWADETYVVLDARHAGRFEAFEEQYRRAGVGLIELDRARSVITLFSHVRRRPNRLEARLIGEQALARLLGLPMGDRPELRLPHATRVRGESEPVVSGADADWVSHLQLASQAS